MNWRKTSISAAGEEAEVPVGVSAVSSRKVGCVGTFEGKIWKE